MHDIERLEEYEKKKIAELEKETGGEQLTDEQKAEKTKQITSQVVSDIESGNAHEDSAKEFKETLDSITTQSIAQVEQKQTSVSQV